MLLELADGVLAAEFEGDHEIRLQRSRKLPRHHRWVSTIRAGGSRRACVTDQLRTTAWAAVSLHAVSLGTPVGAEVRHLPAAFLGCLLFRRRFFFCRLLRRRGLFLLFRVKRLDLCYIIGTTAVIALQLAGCAYKVQRTGAAWALIVGHLCCHACSHPSFFIFRSAPARRRADAVEPFSPICFPYPLGAPQYSQNFPSFCPPQAGQVHGPAAAGAGAKVSCCCMGASCCMGAV